jgi:hypothetical protein
MIEASESCLPSRHMRQWGRTAPTSDGRNLMGMCIQCIAGAMTVGAAATGSRAWIVARAGQWLTPRRKRAITAALVVAGLLGAGLIGPTP